MTGELIETNGVRRPAAVTGAHPSPLTFDERVTLLGSFDFTSDPQDGNPEHVHINGSWVAQNIVTVEIPQLVTLGLGRHASFHRLVAQQFLRLWELWEQRDKLQHVKSFDGSFSPRFKRFNGTLEQRLQRAKTATKYDLSNHAFGTAMDINARWNPLGQPGAAAGTFGSVHELIPEMEECGIASGEYFHVRLDPMHCEAYKIVQAAPVP